MFSSKYFCNALIFRIGNTYKAFHFLNRLHRRLCTAPIFVNVESSMPPGLKTKKKLLNMGCCKKKERRSKVSFAPAWCKRGDSNSHGGCHTHLKRACLPIPTLLQLTYSLIIIANPVDFVNSFFGKSQGLLNLLFCRAWGDGFPWRPHPTPRGADGATVPPVGRCRASASGPFSYDIGAAQTLV